MGETERRAVVSRLGVVRVSRTELSCVSCRRAIQPMEGHGAGPTCEECSNAQIVEAARA